MTGGLSIAYAEAAPSTNWQFSLTNSDPGVVGAFFRLFHDSASPAIGDFIAGFNANARNSAAAEKTYGQLTVKTINVTAGAEVGEVNLNAIVAGTAQSVLKGSDGVQIGAPTGGYKGLGTLNAQALYQQGVALGTAAFVADTGLVHTTGNENIAGTKNFTSNQLTLNNASSFSPQIVMTGSAADSSAGYFIHQKDKASYTLNDSLGNFLWQSKDTGGTYRNPAVFYCRYKSRGSTFVEGDVLLTVTDSAGTQRDYTFGSNGVMNFAVAPTVGGASWFNQDVRTSATPQFVQTILDNSGFARLQYKDAGTLLWTVGLRTHLDQNYYVWQESGSGIIQLGASTTIVGDATVGVGTGIRRNTINGGTGSGEGPILAFQSGGVTKGAMGTYSATITGTGTDFDLVIYAPAGTLYQFTGVKATMYQSSNLPGTAVPWSVGQQMPIKVSSETSGSLTKANSQNAIVNMSGGITIAAGTFDADAIIFIINESGSTFTLTQGGGGTQHRAGTATTGNLTVAAWGFAIIKISHGSTSVWTVAGNVS